MSETARVLLKARPTAAQLADRLAPPLPDGLELYLDADDLVDEAAMRGVMERLDRNALPTEFSLIVEGPIRSLDGEFFHVARGSEADFEVVRRLVWLGERLGAEAINLHAIAPEGEKSLTPARRERLLEQSLPLLEALVSQADAAGMIATVENMPPVLRMRQGGFFFSAIGMVPEDMLCLAERLPGLRLCLDVSHAQLVVNAQRAPSHADGSMPAVHRFLAGFAPLERVSDFLRAIQPLLLTAHLSNASGILGEGLPYGQGDLELDPLLRELAAAAKYLVTETLEPDPEHATYMREAQRRIRQALSGAV